MSWRELWDETARDHGRVHARWLCEEAAGAWGDDFDDLLTLNDRPTLRAELAAAGAVPCASATEVAQRAESAHLAVGDLGNLAFNPHEAQPIDVGLELCRQIGNRPRFVERGGFGGHVSRVAERADGEASVEASNS
jgi:hypothetical protein